MVKVVRRHNLVLNSLVVHRDCMLSIIAPEDKQVLHSELLLLTPSDLQSLLEVLPLALHGLGIQQVKDLLIIDLKEGTVYVDCLILLGLLSLAENLMDGSHR